MMNFVYGGLCLATAFFAVSRAVDIKTIPPLDTFSISSSALPLDVKCLGDVPVTWIVPDRSYARFFMIKNSSVKILNQEINNTYTSILTLEKATYLDTGVYTCEPIFKVDEQDSKRVSIFVNDDNHLLIPPPEILQEIIGEEYDNVTIPCISTSTSVRVILLKKDKVLVPNISHEGMENFHYHPMFGFLLKNVTERSSGLYRCVAVLKTYNLNIVLYKVTILASVKKVVTKIRNLGPVILGQNVSFECSVNMDASVPFTLDWVVQRKFKTEHFNTGKMNYISYSNNGVHRSVGSRLLDIQNVTSDDERCYVCELIVNSERIKYALQPLEVNPSWVSYNYFLNLSVQNGTDEIVSEEGTSEVEFIVEVAANPEPTLTWLDPDGISLGSFSEKILVENNENISKLIIKDLDFFDTGVYELIANNSVFEKRIFVTLLVKSRPVIRNVMYNPLGSFNTPYSDYGCEIYGYPLPDFDLAFRRCSNIMKCDESNTEAYSTFTNVSFYKKLIHQVNIYIINVNTSESGFLVCQASNMFGNSIETFRIWGQ